MEFEIQSLWLGLVTTLPSWDLQKFGPRQVQQPLKIELSIFFFWCDSKFTSQIRKDKQ